MNIKLRKKINQTNYQYRKEKYMHLRKKKSIKIGEKMMQQITKLRKTIKKQFYNAENQQILINNSHFLRVPIITLNDKKFKIPKINMNFQNNIELLAIKDEKAITASLY